MTDTSNPPPTRRDGGRASGLRRLIGRITRLEIAVAAVIAVTMLLLIVIEPDILEAPFENWRTVLFTVGGTAAAGLALMAMLRFGVPPVIRVAVLVVPFLIVNWWLISPYFIDDVVDEGFAVSITDQTVTTATTPEPPAVPSTTEPEEAPAATSAPPATDPPPTTAPPTTAPPTTEPPPPPPPSGPVLLGAGQFVGLAGHRGTGDAGIFENTDGSLVLRFENFDIQNGPDLYVYLVPGPDQTALSEGSIYLGALKGNIGDQNYELPPGTELTPGAYTALVWCEAFSVEFVGATIEI